MTMAQALARYLAQQWTEIDGEERPLFAGVFAIFGHGNVAGVGQALAEMGNRLPTFRAHNEQAMAHAAIAFAKASNRRRIMACTTSIGHGQRAGWRADRPGPFLRGLALSPVP
jgi:3D-(3,5/4)-trihydroxycyclohexane-1,2-dione acylhydrolase (decyclizing)